jgi:hypothetical protein
MLAFVWKGRPRKTGRARHRERESETERSGSLEEGKKLRERTGTIYCRTWLANGSTPPSDTPSATAPETQHSSAHPKEKETILYQPITGLHSICLHQCPNQCPNQCLNQWLNQCRKCPPASIVS